jgi:hypothetical protein
MQKLLAISFLTLRAAIRFKLVLILALLLVCTVVVLPLIIKDDSTARGFIQILLTYTLSVITALLGFSTLWLACGTLAREIEECQMQVVATKPIARWQIWLGKWLGIMMLNLALLAISGGAVYGLLKWRAQRLPVEQQRILQDEIFIARSGVKEQPIDFRSDIELAFKKYLEKNPVSSAEYGMVRKQITEWVKSSVQIVRPKYQRIWKIDLGSRKEYLRGQPLTMRVRFTISEQNHDTDNPKTYPMIWTVGPLDSGQTRVLQMTLASDTFQEVPIPPDMFDESGVLTLSCTNESESDMLFLLDNGMEILYREAGFEINFIRGLLIVACWLGLLTTIGLCAASFLSFPVASFLALGILIVGFSTGTLSQVIEEGGLSGVNHETGKIDTPRLLDQVVVPMFSALLKLVKMVREFTPIESLSSGRSITWAQLGWAFAQIIGVMGGLFSLFGIYMFNRRELATAQGGGQ